VSIPIAQINLAGVIVGTTGNISFANTGIGAGGVTANPANIKSGSGTVHIFNESGSGLLINFMTSGDSFFLPAGGWTDKKVSAGEAGLVYTVIYNLPNPPVTLLLVTYYSPSEPIPYVPTLGNSPIGIGGTIATSFNSLSNETNTVQTLVIDIGQQGNTQLITINSDGSFVWSVLQSGVAHQVLKGEISGSPLLIGKSGDVTEVLGFLNCDNAVTLKNNIPLNMQDSGGTGRTVMVLNATNDLNISNPASSGDIVLNSNTNAVWKILQGSAGVSLLTGTIALLGGSISRQNGGVINCGSGTVISHGCGAQITWVVGTPWITQPGSATVGANNGNTTTFTATVGSGTQIVWVAGTI
jgi:hypothetical protein